MKNNKRIILLVAVCVTLNLSGCASDHKLTNAEIPSVKQLPPTNAEIAAANIGPYPDNYENLVKEWFTNNLKDSDSARYGCITKPNKTYSYDFSYKYANNYNIVYLAMAEVNAKNSYGGYNGWTTYSFYIKNGQILQANRTELPRLSCK